MKIAIPTDGKNIAPHFGRCPAFTIFIIEDNKIVSKEVVENPGHYPGNIPEFLKSIGVDIIIAGGMGQRALILFNDSKIDYVLGADGDIDGIIDSFLKGNLKSQESPCEPGSGKGYGIDKTECDHGDKH